MHRLCAILALSLWLVAPAARAEMIDLVCVFLPHGLTQLSIDPQAKRVWMHRFNETLEFQDGRDAPRQGIYTKRSITS